MSTNTSLLRAPRLDTQLLSDLYIFQQVVRATGMSAAARRIGISQGAVSQRIARLEARLGCQLFNREPGGLKLTAKGRPLADEVDIALAGLADAVGKLRFGESSTLHVNCTPSLAREWLVPALNDFYTRHPGITLVVYADQESMTVGRMTDEGIDIVIRYGTETLPGLVELDTVQEHIAAVRAQGPLSGPSVRLHDATPWDGAAQDAEWSAWEKADAELLPMNGDQRFNLASLAYDSAEAGLGIAMGRLGLVSKRLRDGKLVAAVPRIIDGATYHVLTKGKPPRQSARYLFSRWAVDHLVQSQSEARDIIERQFAQS